MRNVQTDEHRIVVLYDTHVLIFEGLIDAAQLEIELKCNISQVLVVRLLFVRFSFVVALELRADNAYCMNAELDIANPLNLVIQKYMRNR